MNCLKISLSNLAHNYRALRKQLHPQTQLIGVVKAAAYGSEPIAVATHLQKLGVDRLAVAYASEGVQLRKAGIKIPIMVFYPQREGLESILEAQLEPSIYSQYIFKLFAQLVETKDIKEYPIHLKYNTGLNRVGFSPQEADWVLSTLRESKLAVQSVYSHLAATEDPRPSLNCDAQIAAFLKIKMRHEKEVSKPVWYHLLNSSGIFNYTEYQLDAVRTGIALYGFANHSKWDAQLLPAMSLTTHIAQIHTVSKGRTVGYNNGWEATQTSKIATLPLGHADGITRQFGKEKGWVTIKGQQAPIVGNVCMDMMMVDTSQIDCKEGDEVEIFGGTTKASLLAESADTISYELLTGIGQRVQRVVGK